MDVITRSCVLFLWLHTLPFVKSDDCTLEAFLGNEDLYDSNFNTVGLKASYLSGEEVRVGCRAGYSGFFKLQCLLGRWNPIGDKCKPKSCGHPGDAPNADFALEGKDYVFGSRVVYTCHEGYRMVSRRNIRNCVERGWDGVVPVCEALTCPVLSVDSNVLVLGDPEEASFGSVLRFRCRSRSEILSGAQDIFCNEDGVWSQPPPKCTEVKCTVPDIENGFVPRNRQEYKEDDILDYQCHEGYGRIDFRSSTCTKVGVRAEWSPTPICERTVCESESKEQVVTNFRAPQWTQIRVSDTATYSCIRGYKKKANMATCTTEGWTPKPLCEEIICKPQDISNADVDKMAPEYKDQERANVVCKPGYKGRFTLTCTGSGWTRNGRCTEVKCKRQDYKNAQIIGVQLREYGYGAEVNYVCKDGFTGGFTLTCGQDDWIGDAICEVVKCPPKTVSYADIVGTRKAEYNYGDKVQYDCKGDRGIFFLTCGQNRWEGSQQCREITCNRLNILNTEIVGKSKSLYVYKDTVEYSCTGQQQGSFVLTCGREGSWIGSRECKACRKPKVEHGFLVGPYNNMLYYTCEQGYKLMAKGWWGVTKCDSQEAVAQCIEKSDCGALPAIPNMVVQSQHTNHRNGSSVPINCEKGYSSEVQHLTCDEGEWHPNNTLLCTSIAKHCDFPPIIENAVPEEVYQTKYLSGSEITYQCRNHYTMKGGPTIKCINGTWEDGNITCTRITTHCPRPPQIKHAEIISRNREFRSGAWANYRCQEHYTSDRDPKIRCNDGEWGERTFKCIPVSCDPPAVADNIRVQGLPDEGVLIIPGHSLTFSCDQPKILKGSKKLKCGNSGQWNHPIPSCEVVSCAPPADADDIRVQGLPDEGVLIIPGHSLTFSCDQPKVLEGHPKLTCGNNGQWNHPVPSCEVSSRLGCGAPPSLQGGDTTEFPKHLYSHNERVEYSCFNLYTMLGDRFKTCNNGEWTGEMRCLQACTVDEELMRARNIQFRFSYEKKLYAPHGEPVEFSCTRGRPRTSVAMRQICNDGVMDLPNCY